MAGPVEPMDGDAPSPSQPDAALSQERGLWTAWHAGRDRSARERLVETHRPFARTLAAMAYGRRHDDTVDFDDYLHWALVGLIEAIDRFDPIKGVAFRTYAQHRVQGAILNGLESATERHRQQAARRRLLEDRSASLDLLARGASAPAEPAQHPLAHLAQLGMGLALGILLDGTGMWRREDDSADPAANPYRRTELSQLRSRLLSFVDSLPHDQRHVVRSHYFQGQLFEDIARGMSLSKGRVSQIHHVALQSLKARLQAVRIADSLL